MLLKPYLTYSMSLFKIPKTICDGINSTLSKYWWGQTRNEKKIHWINWSKLCESKRKGGMGFRDIYGFNLAMLAKQAWRLLTETHSLFYRVYKARYFPLCTFMDAELGTNPSFVWWSLLQAHEVIREGSIWEVGDGDQLGSVFTSGYPDPHSSWMEQIHAWKYETWLVKKPTSGTRLLAATFTQSTVKDISQCKRGDLNSWDSSKWKETGSSQYEQHIRWHLD